jgi:preprotein translocase subunit SecA
MRAQMRFSAPGEPEGAVAGGGAGSTPMPSFSAPQAARPMGGPLPGTVVPRPAQTMHGMPAAASVGRNDPCPCGSGKKFKKCHGEGA